GVMPCPRCGVSDNVTANGFTNGRRVIGLNETFVLIGRKYKCSACRGAQRVESFVSYDQQVMKWLPRHLQEELQIITTRKVCIEASLLHMLNAHINSAGTYAAFHRMLTEQHQMEFMRMNQTMAVASMDVHCNPPQDFASFDNRSG